jgi:DNA-binding response OmpR family regulator
MNILIIEDDVALATQIVQVFDTRVISHRVRILPGLVEFMRELHLIEAYDIIITDLRLSPYDTELLGYKIIQLVRERNSEIPVIVISSHAEINILRGAFELGASDYIIKPMRLKELELRVINWFRLYEFLGVKFASNVYSHWGIELRVDSNEFYHKWVKISMTKMNKYIFSLFFRHPWKILSEEFLREKIWWDRTAIIDRNLRVVILRLKQALIPSGLSDSIQNIRGEWYLFSLE